MGEPQQLTLGEVEAVVRPLLGPVVSARLLEQKHRNQVFAVGDDAIFKAYLWDGVARQARKVATLRCLEGRGLPVPRLVGHGVLANGTPWTLETRVVAGHVRPTRAELDTPDGWEFHRALGRWLPTLHAFGGFPCFGTWDAGGPATLAAHVLPRARAVRAHAAALDCVPRVLLRRADQELERLEPAIRAADWLRPPGGGGRVRLGVRCPRGSGRGLRSDRRPWPGVADLHRVRGRLPGPGPAGS